MVSSGRVQPLRLPSGVNCSFRATKESRADLCCARSERQGGRRASTIGNPARRNNGHLDRVDYGRNERHEADKFGFRTIGNERGAVAAGLGSLCDDHICARRLGFAGFPNSRDDREPGDPLRLGASYHLWGIEAHNGRDCRWPTRQECLELRLEIRQRAIARAFRHLGTPLTQEAPNFRFGYRVTLGSRIGHPEVELEWSVRRLAHRIDPSGDLGRLHQKRAEGSRFPSVDDGGREARRTRPRHRREHDRQTPSWACCAGWRQWLYQALLYRQLTTSTCCALWTRWLSTRQRWMT